MGWSRIPAPGTLYGPCNKPETCKHRDCAQSREDAARLCPHCQKPIGYEVRCYGWGDTIEHADCLEDKVEREAIERGREKAAE